MHIAGLLQQEPNREQVLLQVLLVQDQPLEAGHPAGQHTLEQSPAGGGGVHVEVEPQDLAGVEGGEEGGDDGAPVSSLAVEPLVTQPRHQLNHRPRRLEAVVAHLLWGGAEPVAGYGGSHHLEHDVTTPGGEEGDDVQELHHRAGPPVDQQQGDDLLPLHRLRLDVEEVDVEAVNVGGEVREAVDDLLLRPPVVGLDPVLRHLPQVVRVEPVEEGRVWQGSNKSGEIRGNPGVYLLQLRVSHIDCEGLDLVTELGTVPGPAGLLQDGQVTGVQQLVLQQEVEPHQQGEAGDGQHLEYHERVLRVSCGTGSTVHTCTHCPLSLHTTHGGSPGLHLHQPYEGAGDTLSETHLIKCP